MASEDHKRGDKINGFCTVPAKPKCSDCPGSKDYIEVCKPKWASHTFERIVRAEKARVDDKKYEAHHIACVAPITQHVLGNKDIKDVVAQTKWCINNKLNMLGMPVWGHTVKWYCDIDDEDGEIDTTAKAPPFKNIPQHDIDHNSSEGYTWEVEQRAKAIAEKVEEAEHKMQSKTLAKALDKISTDFKTKLQDRGTRLDGTHAAWKLAQAGNAKWSHPFSMASDDKVSSPSFPARNFDEKLKKWIKKISAAIAGV